MEVCFCPNAALPGQAYALLAWAARRRWGLEVLPALARAEGGKPFFPERPELCFSLSHSGPLALCALDEAPVGADVERVRPHHPGLARRVCSPEELAWLDAQSDRERALCVIWTGKESLVKYTGTGLTVPLRAIAPPLPPQGEKSGLLFRRRSGPEWEACVCGRTEPERWTQVDTAELPPPPPVPPHAVK